MERKIRLAFSAKLQIRATRPYVRFIISGLVKYPCGIQLAFITKVASSDASYNFLQ